jgi:hypothetical protein
MAVDGEIGEVLNRPLFSRAITASRRERILATLWDAAAWFDPAELVADCRDPKDNKYLEFALVSGDTAIVSGDLDLLVLHPWRGVRILRPADIWREPVEMPDGLDVSVSVTLPQIPSGAEPVRQGNVVEMARNDDVVMPCARTPPCSPTGALRPG